MKVLTFLFIICILISPVLAAYQYVAEAWKALNWKSTFTVVSSTQSVTLTKQASKAGITSSPLLSNFTFESYDHPITIIGVKPDLLMRLLQRNNILPYSILLVHDRNELNLWFQLRDELKGLMKTRAFYRLSFNDHSNEPQLSLIMTILNEQKILEMNMRMNQLGLATPEFNLKGAVLSSSAETYPPFLKIIKCEEGNIDCEVSGMGVEVFQLLEKMFNFKMKLNRNENWGAIPTVSWRLKIDFYNSFVGQCFLLCWQCPI